MAKYYQSTWPYGPRCQVCEELAKDLPRVEIDIGAWPHIFEITDMPVEGQPGVSAVRALCDSLAWGVKVGVPSGTLLDALEVVSPEEAIQGKASVAMDILGDL